MTALKQLFGVEKQLKFELCVTFAESWEDDIEKSVTEAMGKITKDLIRDIQNEALNFLNKTMIENLESQCVSEK